MNCLRQAFLEAGYDLPLKSWFPIKDIPHLCKLLNLEWYDYKIGDLELGIEPVIVIYKTSKDKGHAVYTESIEPYLKYPIVGIIKFNVKRNP